MNPSPANSFLRFFAGFALLVSLSLGITFAVQSYTSSQDAERQQAAAAAALVKQIK